MEVFTNTILPLMILIAIGYSMGRFFPGDGVIFSKTTLWVFASVLTFTFINDHPLTLDTFLTYGGAFLIIFVYNFILFKVILRKNKHSDTFFLTSVFGNTGYLGYPVLGLALGGDAIAYGVMYSIISVTIVNTIGVTVILKDFKKSISNLFKLPFIYSVIIGLVLGYLGINWHNLPKPFFTSMKMINDAAIPVITIFLGVLISKIELKKENLSLIFLASLHRLLVIPFVAFIGVLVFKMEGLEKSVFLIESAMPTAMNAAVISSAIKKEPEVVSSEVALSTLLSAITLPIVISLVK